MNHQHLLKHKSEFEECGLDHSGSQPFNLVMGYSYKVMYYNNVVRAQTSNSDNPIGTL